MTTRKDLCDRLQEMPLGTQEMLDSAAQDARLIPFETLFCGESGLICFRKQGFNLLDSSEKVVTELITGDLVFFGAAQLRPLDGEM